MSEITKIPTSIDEAIGWLDDAIQKCSDSQPEEPQYQWPAMNDLIDNLERIKKELKSAIPMPIQLAIESQAAADSEMEDRADALSY